MDNALVTHPQTPQEASVWYRENLAVNDPSGAKRAQAGSMEGVQSTAAHDASPNGARGGVMMDGGSKPNMSWPQQQPSANGAPAAAQASLSMPQGNGAAGVNGSGAGDAPTSQTAGDAAAKNGLTVAGSGIVPVLQ